MAVELPDGLRKRISAVQRDFDDEGISLVKRGALHVTLSFLGDISEDDSKRVTEELGELRIRRFSAECRGLGYFSPDRISVIFAKVYGSDGFERLYRCVSDAVGKVIGQGSLLQG